MHYLQWSSTWHIFSWYWHLDSCDMHTDVTCIILTTWHSWTYHVILSCDLMFLWLYYTTVTRPGHLMFIIYTSHHACTVSLYMIYRLDFFYICYYYQFSIILIILFLLFQHPTCAVTAFFIFFFYCPFVYSCWSTSDGLYYFSVSRFRKSV